MDGILHDISRAVKVRNLFNEDTSVLRAHETSPTVPSMKLELVESGAGLIKEDIKACIDLVEATSGRDYKASSIGWHRSAKMEEMTDKEMIYLIVRADNTETISTLSEAQGRTTNLSNTVDHALSSGTPTLTHSSRIVGFLSFMFTNDDPPYEDREVVYIYEIHLDESLRGRGLGSALIRFAEHAAQHCGITKTMLTVFTANLGARTLYERLGYTKDACSPRDKVMRRKVVKADYIIMSKELAGVEL